MEAERLERDFVDVIMNPVRQRIVQYLLLHARGTAGEIGAELSDVPRPSLYRHLKVLLEAGCIEVVEQKPVRGAVERTYALVAQPLQDATQQQVQQLVQGTILHIAGEFASYFAGADPDPQRDLLSVSTSTLLLSDQELMEMFGRIGQVLNDYIQNKPTAERKARSITLISAPPRMEREEEAHAENRSSDEDLSGR